MKRLLILLPVLLLFFACEEASTSNNSALSGPEQPTANPSPGEQRPIQTPETTTPPADEEIELNGSPLDFASFNEQIKKAQSAKEEWVSTPLLVALKFTGAGMDSKIKSLRARQLGPGESVEDVFVSVEEDGLMDDSVSGTLTILRMKNVDGTWQLYKAARAWKCWKGRGHETYSGQPCS